MLRRVASGHGNCSASECGPIFGSCVCSFASLLFSGIVCQLHHLQHLAAMQLMTEAAEEAVQITHSDSRL